MDDKERKELETRYSYLQKDYPLLYNFILQGGLNKKNGPLPEKRVVRYQDCDEIKFKN